jgi:hypothetical protein
MRKRTGQDDLIGNAIIMRINRSHLLIDDGTLQQSPNDDQQAARSPTQETYK